MSDQERASSKKESGDKASGTKASGPTAADVVRPFVADMWHAVRTHRNVQVMILLLVVCAIGWNMPYASTLLYPFKLFVTCIHEACHALAARFTGGNVAVISIAPDESGLTMSMGGVRPIVTMAGYLGTAVFGGVLIWWGRRPESARSVLQSIGVVIIALTLFYGGGGFFSFLWMALIGVAILMIARKAPQSFCHTFLLFLAVITTISAVMDIEVLFMASVLSDAQSDAKTMEQLTMVPAVVWSVLWGLTAIVILIFALWLAYKPDRGDKARNEPGNGQGVHAGDDVKAG